MGPSQEDYDGEHSAKASLILNNEQVTGRAARACSYGSLLINESKHISSYAKRTKQHTTPDKLE